MKRWEDFLKEDPSPELTARTEKAVFQEMQSSKPRGYAWLSLATGLLGVLAVVGGYRLSHREESAPGAEFLELAEDSEVDIEMLEDLEVIELLEELEEWTA